MTAAEIIESALHGLDYERVGDHQFVVQLPGERRLKTACWLSAGRHALSVEAFVMRHPDEDPARLYAHLLRQNARMYGVAWSIDDNGDVYLTGRLPIAAVTTEVVDRLLGAVLDYADGTFNTLLQLGFGESIRREWAWRVKNGESLANLAAFEDFVNRASLQPGRDPGHQ